MARERLSGVSTSEDTANQAESVPVFLPRRWATNKVLLKKKKKDRRTKVAFCPNSSKRSLNRSSNRSVESWTALKKNNDDLAKNLNRYKAAFATKETEILRLTNENMELASEIRILRLQFEKAEEAYINRLSQLKAYSNKALDNMVGFQESMTQIISITNGTLRASLANRASRGSSLASVGHNRTSSGSSAPLFGTGRSKDSGRNQPHDSPQKQLPQSKVAPMIAGHTISRPQIRLTRMNLPTGGTSESSPDPQPTEEPLHMNEEAGEEENQHEQDDMNEEEEGDLVVEDALEAQEPDQMEIPESPRRTRFNITVIREESRVESPVEDSLAQTPQSESSPRQSDDSLNHSVRRRVKSVSRRVSRNRFIDLSVSTSPSPGVSDRRGAEASASDANQMSNILRGSPQVDILKSRRHPAVVLNNLTSADCVTNSGPSSPSNPGLDTSHVISDDNAITDTPLTVPIEPNSQSPVLPKPPFTITEEDFANPSDSLLERLGCDPMEGPSWLFNSVKKKKKRRSAVKRLSSLLSDDQKSSSMEFLDSSDIGSESESSGLIQGDLVSNVFTPPMDSSDANVAEASGFLGTSSRVTGTPVDTTRFLQKLQSNNLDSTNVSSEEESSLISLNKRVELTDISADSDEENRPSQNSGLLSLCVEGGRTPLREIYLEPQGKVVTYNPKLDTGVVISDLKKAMILVENTRSSAPKSLTPVKLSECYIDLTPGRRMSIEDVMNLGLSSIQSRTSPDKGKRLSVRKEPGRNKSQQLKPSRRVSALAVKKAASLPETILSEPPCGDNQMNEAEDSNQLANPVDEISAVGSAADSRISTPQSDASIEKAEDDTKGAAEEDLMVSPVMPEELAAKDDLEPDQVAAGEHLVTSGDKSIQSINQASSVDVQCEASSVISDSVPCDAEDQLNTLEENAEEREDSTVYRKSSRKLKLTKKMQDKVENEVTSRSGKRKQHSEPIIESKRKRESETSSDVKLESNPVKKKAKSAMHQGKKSGKLDEQPALDQDEEKVKADPLEVVEAPPDDGRRRRAASKISFKEPSLRGKMRRGDAGSSSIYADFNPNSKIKQSKRI